MTNNKKIPRKGRASIFKIYWTKFWLNVENAIKTAKGWAVSAHLKGNILFHFNCDENLDKN